MRHGLGLAFLALLVPAPAVAGQGVIGYWLTENRKAIVETKLCDGKICGHMVWMSSPLDAAGRAKVSADGQPLCGVQLIGELAPRGGGKWKDGWILDPRSGDTYSADIALLSDRELRVRGYLGLPFLGSSQRWTRVSDDRGGC